LVVLTTKKARCRCGTGLLVIVQGAVAKCHKRKGCPGSVLAE